MNQVCTQLVSSLFRSGLVLTFSAVVVMMLMRRYPIASSRLRRLVYFAVILQGCLLLKLPLELFSVQLLKPAPVQQRLLDDDRTEQIRALAFDIAEAMFAGEIAAQPGAVANPARWRIPWMVTIAGVWIAGMLVIVSRSVWHYVWFLREVAKRTRPSAGWDHEWKALQQRYRSKHQVTFKLCEGVGPLVCFHPGGYQLIVPSEVWGMLEPRQRMMILRHELAHLQRYDLWKSLAMRLLALVHWFNPLVWKIVRRFDEDAECACDDAVRIADSTSAIDYARTLLLLGGPHGSISLASQAASEPGLADRIRRMIFPATMKDSNMKKYLIAAVVLSISTLQLLRFELKADEPSALSTEKEAGATIVETTTIDGSTETPRSNEQSVAASFVGNTIGVASLAEKQPVIDVRFVLNNLEEYQAALQDLKREHQSQLDRLRDQIQSARQGDDEAKFNEMQLLLERQANETLNKHVKVSMSLYRKIMDESAIYSQEHQLPPVRTKTGNKQLLSSLSNSGRHDALRNALKQYNAIQVAGGDTISILDSTNASGIAAAPNLKIASSNSFVGTITFSDGTTSVATISTHHGNNFKLDTRDGQNGAISSTSSAENAQPIIVAELVTPVDVTWEKPNKIFAGTTFMAGGTSSESPTNGISFTDEPVLIPAASSPILTMPNFIDQNGFGIASIGQDMPVANQNMPVFGESMTVSKLIELDISWEIITRLNTKFERTQGEQSQTKGTSAK